jgi:hypothetical protein
LRCIVGTGTRIKALSVAGVTRRELQAALDDDRDFAEAIETAMGEYLDTCEEALVATSRRGNPVGLIVRLNAGRPAEYIERSASIDLNAELTQKAPIADGVALLRGMLESTTPATQRMLSGAPLEDAPQPEAP